MKVMEFIKYHLTSVNKALNMIMPVSLFIDFHRLQCLAINNYHNYSIWVFVNSYLATIFFVLKMLSAFFFTSAAYDIYCCCCLSGSIISLLMNSWHT